MSIGEDVVIRKSFKSMIESNPAVYSWADTSEKVEFFTNDFNELRRYFGLLQFKTKVKYVCLKDAFEITIERKGKFLATLEFETITENTCLDVMNYIINHFLTFKDYNTMMKRQEAAARERKIKF